jgi:hypothetical protein
MDRACAPVLSFRMDGFNSLFCVRYRLRCRFVCTKINVEIWCLHVEANIIVMFFLPICCVFGCEREGWDWIPLRAIHMM